ncbi:MAG: hypothetical protein H6713_08470 [Myxococcales bacterium]|nr:hypothetical protein [Myxococcales bacterium]MCB9750022.1 hypothetical protein [Myxococcales bacterium]
MTHKQTQSKIRIIALRSLAIALVPLFMFSGCKRSDDSATPDEASSDRDNALAAYDEPTEPADEPAAEDEAPDDEAAAAPEGDEESGDEDMEDDE